MNDDPQPTEEEMDACDRLRRRIRDLFARTQVVGVSDQNVRRIQLHPEVVLQHFQSYLLGHETLAELVRGARASGQWAQLPDDLVSAVTGMAAEAGIDITPRKITRPVTPLHVIMTGGMLAHYAITDNGSTLDAACEYAGRELLSLGLQQTAPALTTIATWTRRYAKREGLQMPKRGRPKKDSATPS